MYVVGHISGYGPKFYFDTYDEAVDKITEIHTYDPDGVDSGDYYIEETTEGVTNVI